MEKRLIGLDICDTYTQVCCAGLGEVQNYPTVVCKKKNEDTWLVGQDAYASALEGNGVIVDKLLKLLRKEGTATIGGVRYEGLDLMQKFLECVLSAAVREADRAEEAANAGPDEESARGEAADAGTDEGNAREEAAAAGADEESARGEAANAGPDEESARGESADAVTDEGNARDEKTEGGVTGEGRAQADAAKNAGTGAQIRDAEAQGGYDPARIARLVITVPKISARLMDMLVYCADRLKIPRDRIRIISHTESFLYYVLSQKREVWNNQVGMFDLSEDFLCYYEMKVQRGMRQVTVVADREKLDEGFNLDILNTPSGVKLADKILCSCGERFLQKKLFSSIFLTGKGFESQDWATDFMKLVCTRRKVYVDQALFVQGAAYKAADLDRDKTMYPYVLVCDGRLDTTVSMKVMRRDQEDQMILAAAGDSWYEARTTLEFILDNQQYLEFMISPADPKRRKVVKLILEGFPERDDKTLRIQLQVTFLDENTMAVTVKDMGFGEFYPSTGAVIRQEVML